MLNINKKVIKQLEKLRTKGPKQIEAAMLNSASSQGYIVGIPTEVNTPSVALTLEDYDRYSVKLRTLEVSHNHFSFNDQRPQDYLYHCTELVVKRLTYLEEPLALVEFDTTEKMAQLRSMPPQQNEDEVIYWEALLWVRPYPKAKLVRYRWVPGNREREVLAYPATFGTLGRLAQDIALSIAGELE